MGCYHLACHFKHICSISTVDGNIKLQDIYVKKRSLYTGTPFTNARAFDAERSELDLIKNMKRGKAAYACLDGLAAEHLQHCHLSLPTFFE